MKTTKMQTFQLGKLLEECLAECSVSARQKKIEFTPVTDFVFDITLSADKKKIESLLCSALKNMFDHSGATSVVFSVRPLLQSEKSILLEFSLETNGAVTASAGKFSFFRSLITSRNLIEELKGKSEFALSPAGSVLKFIIGFELQPCENDRAAINVSLLRGRKLLVVDDNEINRNTLVRFLEGHGIECTQASNGIKAIELLEKNNFYDLILLDLLMPQMDGFETAAYIRKKLKNQTPIIAVPARNKTWISLMCGEVGINNFIHKPFAGSQLLQLINTTLVPAYVTDSSALMKTA